MINTKIDLLEELAGQLDADTGYVANVGIVMDNIQNSYEEADYMRYIKEATDNDYTITNIIKVSKLYHTRFKSLGNIKAFV